MLPETKVRIQSTSSKDEYALTLQDGKATKCSCPDCYYRKRTCKHQTRFNVCEVVSAFVKPSGIICARVCEGDASYFVTISPDGTGERCSCCVGASGCVHTCKVQVSQANIYPAPEPDAETIAALAEDRNMQKLAAYRRSIAPNAYSVLAPTKDVIGNKFAYGCCGHIVKPEHEGCLCGACLSK